MYTKNIWQTGDTVTAEKLNNIESGIVTSAKTETTILAPTYQGYIIDNLGKNGTSWKGLKSIYTPSFIHVGNSEIVKFKSTQTCYIKIFYYNNNYTLISSSEYISVNNSTDTSVSIVNNCQFIKFYCVKDTSISSNLNNISVFLTGNFTSEDALVKNPGTTDVTTYGSYYSVAITVNAADISTSSTTTSSASLLENNNFLPDYGVLALPSTYKNTGKPTRLILYMHGAGVHFSAGATRFDTGSFGMDADYWLSEGYAILDIEGDPFGNTYKSFFIPQSTQAYIEAYKFVVNNFNICTNGIFIGGRSMGAGMCLNFIMQNTVPVLACCPVAPTQNFFHYWNAMDASNRKFVAEKYGIPGASSITYGSSTMTTDEFNLLKTNYAQLAQCCPMFKVIEDLPDANTMISQDFNVAYTTTEPPTSEKELYDTLKVKTKIPFKFFVSAADPSAPYKRNAMYMYTMLRNGGSVAEMHIFPTGGHGFERESQNKIASYTNTKGITMSNVSIAYIEMLKFWRRYENN